LQRYTILEKALPGHVLRRESLVKEAIEGEGMKRKEKTHGPFLSGLAQMPKTRPKKFYQKKMFMLVHMFSICMEPILHVLQHTTGNV
jgi:hypothetical protein